VVGPATAAAIGDRFVLNELDWVKVKGKDEPLSVYELVAEKAAAGEAERAYPGQYHAALALYRAGRFAEAEERWRVKVTHPTLIGPSPPLVMAERAAALRADPPSTGTAAMSRRRRNRDSMTPFLTPLPNLST